MDRKIGVLCFVASAVALSGCTHTHKVQGKEAKSEIPEGIRVAIGSKEVQEGDKVQVLRSVCRDVTRSAAGMKKWARLSSSKCSIMTPLSFSPISVSQWTRRCGWKNSRTI
jgi:hypothetical protein